MSPKKKIRVKKGARKKKPLSPLDNILARCRQLCPEMKEASNAMQESWLLFCRKLLMAKKMKTTVQVITLNPQLLENREKLQKEFGCIIQSPTEARFGLDIVKPY